MADRGSDTKTRLIESAVRLFSQKWYGTVSVAEICRDAGLSNGVFYRYFSGKEELFKTILGTTHDMIAAAIASVEVPDPRKRLETFTDVITRVSLDHPEHIAVFREGQYRFIEYERRLEELYQKGLGRVLGTSVGMPECVFALGGIRFCATRRALHGSRLDTASVFALIEKGFFPGLGFSADLVFQGPVNPLPLGLEEGSADCLLRAGKRLFGEKGFFETNIHEITDAVGLSVGAFYTYFESKNAFYAELIRRAGRDIRRFIAANMPAGLNRLEREMRGLWLFALYLQSDKDCYGIVREAEFVLSDEVRAYYGAFIEGYRKQPLSADGLQPGVDEETAIEFLIGVNHYLGIESAFTDSTANLRTKVEAIGRYLASGFSCFLDGGMKDKEEIHG